MSETLGDCALVGLRMNSPITKHFSCTIKLKTVIAVYDENKAGVLINVISAEQAL